MDELGHTEVNNTQVRRLTTKSAFSTGCPTKLATPKLELVTPTLELVTPSKKCLSV